MRPLRRSGPSTGGDVVVMDPLGAGVAQDGLVGGGHVVGQHQLVAVRAVGDPTGGQAPGVADGRVEVDAVGGLGQVLALHGEHPQPVAQRRVPHGRAVVTARAVELGLRHRLVAAAVLGRARRGSTAARRRGPRPAGRRRPRWSRRGPRSRSDRAWCAARNGKAPTVRVWKWNMRLRPTRPDELPSPPSGAPDWPSMSRGVSKAPAASTTWSARTWCSTRSASR